MGCVAVPTNRDIDALRDEQSELLRAAATLMRARFVGSGRCLASGLPFGPGWMTPSPNKERVSAPADELRDALSGETGEASEQAVGDSRPVCRPQRRSQPAAGSLELSLGGADSLERLGDGGEAGGDLRPRLSPAGHESGLRARGDVSFLRQNR